MHSCDFSAMPGRDASTAANESSDVPIAEAAAPEPAAAASTERQRSAFDLSAPPKSALKRDSDRRLLLYPEDLDMSVCETQSSLPCRALFADLHLIVFLALHLLSSSHARRQFVCKLADLGNACWIDKHFTEDITYVACTAAGKHLSPD